MAIAKNLAEAYAAIEEMGGTSPEHKNFANLAAAVETITGGGGLTLAGLKKALLTGKNLPDIGTEIPDEYNGNKNPLIVAQYLDSTNNSSYGGAVGAILIRKYVEPVSQTFGSTAIYSTSTIKSFLDKNYLNNCSDAIKSLIAEVSVPYNNTTVKGKFFLMSNIEICCRGSNGVTEGVMWDFWKQKTGLTSPSDSANSGRIMKDRSGTARAVWLRSCNGDSYAYFVSTPGGGGYSLPSNTYGVLPACFISATPTSLSDIKLMLNAGKEIPIGTEIPDTWNGEDAPLIVTQNQMINLANGTTKKGIFLQRKYVTDDLVSWRTGVGTLTAEYDLSTINQYFQTTYLDKCSDQLKPLLAETKVPYDRYYAADNHWFTVNAKWSTISINQNYGNSNSSEDPSWQYYTAAMGSATHSASPARIVTTKGGVKANYWTRNQAGNNTAKAFYIDGTGALQSANLTDAANLLPVCAIVAD